MKKLYVSLCSCFIVLGVTACNQGSGNSNAQITATPTPESSLTPPSGATLKYLAQKNQLQGEGDKERKLELGNGFDSRTGMVTALNSDACMASSELPEDQRITYSNPQGDISWTKTYTAAEIGDMLGTSIEGSANFGMFSASVSGKYTREAMDKRNTLHFNYAQNASMDAKYNIKGLGTQILSEGGKSLLASGMNDFTEVCGDSVVRSAKVGAMLLVDVAVEFQNHDIKTKFEGEAKGSIAGIGFIAGKTSQFSRTNNTNSQIKISVHQFGGDVTKLSEIFGKPDVDGNYNVTGCMTDDESSMKRCRNFISDIMNYADSSFKNSISFKNTASLFTYDYTISKYSQMDVKASLPLLTDEQQAAKEYLVDTITQDRRMLAYLQAYQHQSFYNNSSIMDYQTKKDVDQAINDYTKMVNEYNNYQIIDSCYGDTANINTLCIYAANQVKQMRIKYKQSINIANSLGGTVVVWQSGLGTLVLVPVRAWSTTWNDNDIYDYMTVYEPNTHKFSNDTACVFDTTANSSYMKNIYPQMVGSSLVCDGGNFSNSIYYIKRFGNFHSTGIGGRIINGQQVNYPVMNSGYNSSYSYSDATTLKYSPI